VSSTVRESLYPDPYGTSRALIQRSGRRILLKRYCLKDVFLRLRYAPCLPRMVKRQMRTSQASTVALLPSQNANAPSTSTRLKFHAHQVTVRSSSAFLNKSSAQDCLPFNNTHKLGHESFEMKYGFLRRKRVYELARPSEHNYKDYLHYPSGFGDHRKRTT
jgi:hypothetical protein